MPTTRREFIQRFGIMLASLLTTRCAPASIDLTPTPTDTPTLGMDVRTRQLLRDMHNDDVEWHGTYTGLLPRLVGEPSLELLNTEERIEPLLVEALLEEERFVAAHVLLTMRVSAATGSLYEISAEGWNDLRVQLFADGSVSYVENDLEALHRRWVDEFELID